jgi:methionyl-tRNA formyltransferase
MKIVLLGSTYLSAIAEKALQEHHFVCHVPSKSPLFKGKMLSPIVSLDSLPAHNIKLSVQFDQKLGDIENAFNIHTGLLPAYGGCDILYHTIENKDNEQGLTCHKMSKDFDNGQIVAKLTYPVLTTDTVLDLYKKICVVLPHFVCLSVEMIRKGIIGEPTGIPKMYYRGKVKELEKYENDTREIMNYINAHLR